MPREAFRCAVIQLESGDDLGLNLERVRRQATRAAGAGARLVVLPENFAYFGDEGGKASLAEDLTQGGPICEALVELARALGVTLVAGGMPEASPEPARPFNTSLVLAPGGQRVAAYRKLHLFDVELADGTVLAESRSTTAGDEAVVVDVEGVKVGLAICYDLRFPRLFEALSRRGAELVLVTAAFTEQTGKDHWHALLRARAIESQVWLAAAAQWGRHPGGRRTYGHSLICDPWGTVVAQCSDGAGFAVADIDLDYLDEVRRRLPCLRHRRDDV